MESNKEITNYTSISPDFKQVFSVKKNKSNMALYYRSYYRIVARQKAILDMPIIGDTRVEWVTDDIAVFTFESLDDKVQTFVGTYGGRGSGSSYAYVGPEMQGVWQGDGVEVISKPEGIQVSENGRSDFFDWDHVKQFGTIAVVLEQDGEAKWTIALNKDFKADSDSSVHPSGSILLTKATIKAEATYTLNYDSPYDYMIEN